MLGDQLAVVYRIGQESRRVRLPLRGITCLVPSALGPVARASLLAVGHAGCVERAADDLVAHTRKVLRGHRGYEDHRVLLQVMADARDVGGDFHAVVGQPHGRPSAGPSSASWASRCTPACRRRASAASPSAPGLKTLYLALRPYRTSWLMGCHLTSLVGRFRQQSCSVAKQGWDLQHDYSLRHRPCAYVLT